MKRTLFKAGLLTVAVALAAASTMAGERKLEMEYTWTVEASYPGFDNEAADAAVRSWLESHIEKLMDDGKAMASADPVRPKGSMSVSIDYGVARVAEKYGSILFHTSIYPSGAAHPMQYADSLLLDLATGDSLTLNQLFVDPDKALAIMSGHAPGLLKKYLAEERSDAFPEGVGDDVLFMEGLKPEPKNYDCLELAPEAITVHFQPYQVLPYVFGMPSVTFPMELLEPAGPNPSIWGGAKR